MAWTLRLPALARSRSASAGLMGGHRERPLLWLRGVVELGCQIVPPQRDAEQKLHSGHDGGTIDYAEAGFDQMQLEEANVVGGRGVGRALEERRKALAALNVAALRMRPKLAGGHVLDHALTQRANGVSSTHGEYPPV